jgi:hypothetical protein
MVIFCEFWRLFYKTFKIFYDFHKKVWENLKSFPKKGQFWSFPHTPKTALFATTPFFDHFPHRIDLNVDEKFSQLFAKKHNFLQKLPKFPVFGPKMGSRRVPPKSGQKWQKWWSTSIGLRTLGDGIGIYLVPEIWGKKRQIWKNLQKVVIL